MNPVLKGVFLTLLLLFLVDNIYSSGNLISYANAKDPARNENPRYSFIASEKMIFPQNSSGATTAPSSLLSSISKQNVIVTNGSSGAASSANPSQSGSALTSGNNQARTLPASCNTQQNGIVTVTKIVSDPSNVASGSANTLPFTIVLTANGFPNTLTLTASSSAAAFCIPTGQTFGVTETALPTQFTFSSPTFSSGCNSTVQAGQTINCTITNTITGTGTGVTTQGATITIPGNANVMSNPNMIAGPRASVITPQPIVISTQANNTGHLKIITHNVNNCKPQSSCAYVSKAFYPTIRVHTFENNYYSEISNFPGSEVGRTVNFFINAVPPVTQYDVSQDRSFWNDNSNITTQASPGCEGIIHGNENKVCMINNYIYSTNILSNELVNGIQQGLGQLKIITHNVNNCKPQSSCDVAALRSSVAVHTFDQNKYLILTVFPGSEVGRTVNFYIGHVLVPIQYDVSAISEAATPLALKNANVTTNKSYLCEGVIHPTDNKTCIINNVITNQKTSQNMTAHSANSPLLPSNVTSARK